MIEHVVALHHVRIVHVTEDLDLATDLKPGRVVVVTIYHFQRVDPTRGSMDHPVNRPSGSAPDAVRSLQLRKVEIVAGPVAARIGVAAAVIAAIHIIVGMTG